MKEVVGINHLVLIKGMLDKCSNLLNGGRDVHPYFKWKDSLEEISEEIEEYLQNEKDE